MAFTIPNKPSAGISDEQAEPDSVDLDILVAGIGGDGVASGCAVTAQGSPNMTVAVAAGFVRIGGSTVVVAAGNVTITSNASGNPRFDLISVNSSGTKSATAGATNANPVFPGVPSTSAVLAAVWVPSGVSAITTGHIVDKRTVVSPLEVSLSAQTGSYTLVLADAGKAVEMTVAGANNLTVPPNSSVAFPVGTVIEVAQLGAGTTTLVAGGGVTLQSRGALLNLAGQFAVASIRKRATDTWLVAGDLA